MYFLVSVTTEETATQRAPSVFYFVFVFFVVLQSSGTFHGSEIGVLFWERESRFLFYLRGQGELKEVFRLSVEK